MDLTNLKKRVKAAQEEFDMVVAFHETWKPAAFDVDLHARMGASYASQSFLVIKAALRREMLMGMMRIWDYANNSVKIRSVVDDVLSDAVIDALVVERMGHITKNGPGIGMDQFQTLLRKTMVDGAKEAAVIFRQYDKDGKKRPVLEKVRTLRHEHLAHRQTTATVTTGADATDEEIELFYQDTLCVVQSLLSIVYGVAYDPQDTASVYGHYAAQFWAGARGENTPGHPNYAGTS